MDYRSLVIGSDTPTQLANGQIVPSIDFDNASTKPPFAKTFEAMKQFAPMYTSINGGQYHKALYSEQQYEKAREEVLNFVRADKKNNTVIFEQNTTQGINKLAYVLSQIIPGSVILSSDMEHHANILPWSGKFPMEYTEVDDLGRLRLDDLEQKLKKNNGSVKLVAITGASNVTGYVNPIHEIAVLAHRYNAQILVDGAQLAPHSPIDMKTDDSPEHIDFLVFSAHKMYSPFGVGALIAPRATFEKTVPEYAGSTNTKNVTKTATTWETPPLKEEAGSPNVMGVIALQAALETLNSIGMETIKKLEGNLSRLLYQGLTTLSGIEVYCDISYPRIPVLSLNVERIPHDLLAKMLAMEVAAEVRNGLLSAQFYTEKLLERNPNIINNYLTDYHPAHSGMVRLSLAFYNTEEEINRFVQGLSSIITRKKDLVKKYSPGNRKLASK